MGERGREGRSEEETEKDGVSEGGSERGRETEIKGRREGGKQRERTEDGRERMTE